jgi:chromosome partitioning protein
MAHIIVFGNEKGGTGKSTTAMHVTTALVRMGHSVGVLDLDLRQRSLARYLENRTAFSQKSGVDLPMAHYAPLNPASHYDLPEGEEALLKAFQDAMLPMDEKVDFLVIDCPGAHTYLSQLAHAMADTLITPMNDSFVDFDLLAKINPETNSVIGPSIYSEMVWGARKARAESGSKPIDWIVTRNRIGAQNMVNKRKVGSALTDLSRRIGFRLIPGFSDRVIFRELFPRGLTLLDLKDAGAQKLNISNIAARQELRDLVADLKLPDVKVDF